MGAHALAGARIQPLFQFRLVELGDHLPRSQARHRRSAQAIRRRRLAAPYGTTQLVTAVYPAHQVHSQQILDLSHAQLSCPTPALPWKKGQGWGRKRLASSRPGQITATFRSHDGQQFSPPAPKSGRHVKDVSSGS
jgi:hypothetical protein